MLTSQNNLYDSFFTVSFKPAHAQTLLIMKMHTNEYTTRNLQNVAEILDETLPSIFNSTCYNDANLPFSLEMLNTEIGHLYEHILLEYIAILKRKSHSSMLDFYGTTSWDWSKSPRGTFNIVINIGADDLKIMEIAMKMAGELLAEILMPLALPALPGETTYLQH